MNDDEKDDEKDDAKGVEYRGPELSMEDAIAAVASGKMHIIEWFGEPFHPTMCVAGKQGKVPVGMGCAWCRDTIVSTDSGITQIKLEVESVPVSEVGVPDVVIKTLGRPAFAASVAIKSRHFHCECLFRYLVRDCDCGHHGFDQEDGLSKRQAALQCWQLSGEHRHEHERDGDVDHPFQQQGLQQGPPATFSGPGSRMVN